MQQDLHISALSTDSKGLISEMAEINDVLA